MIRYIFLHLDGVVLENILAPVLLNLVRKLGGEYSADLETNLLSRSQKHAASYLIGHLNLQLSVAEVIDLYKQERKAYILANEVRQKRGLEPFLEMLNKNGYQVISYGGADRDYFLENTRNVRHYFAGSGYIQTRDIRPGVREIIENIYGIQFQEALFVDETMAVAEAAREHNVPFIGFSPEHSFSFQRSEMELLGVKFLAHSLNEIDLELLSDIQKAALRGAIWK